jgi:hypothetical protein
VAAETTAAVAIQVPKYPFVQVQLGRTLQKLAMIPIAGGQEEIKF